MHFRALETRLKVYQYDYRFVTALSPRFVETRASRAKCVWRPWKMHLGLVGGFGGSIRASGVWPGASAKLKHI